MLEGLGETSMHNLAKPESKPNELDHPLQVRTAG